MRLKISTMTERIPTTFPHERSSFENNLTFILPFPVENIFIQKVQKNSGHRRYFRISDASLGYILFGGKRIHLQF